MLVALLERVDVAVLRALVSVWPRFECQARLEVMSGFKGLFTWKEGNPPTRVTLLEGLPFSIVFPSFVYMRGRVTLGGGLPYLLARVTLIEGTTFCLFKPCKRSR